MKLTYVLPTLFIAIFLSSCATVKVNKVDSLHPSNHGKYARVKPDVQGDKIQVNTLGITEANIRNAVKAEFTKKGIVEDEQMQDLLLMYPMFTTQKTENAANPAPLYPYYGYGFSPRSFYFKGRLVPIGYGGCYNPCNTGYHTEQYTDGTLIIDVIDAKTNELAWRGSMENTVDDAGGLSRQFAKESKEILAKYPDAK